MDREKTSTRHVKSSLGLDISRKFAELMGGVLVCRSEVGKGSEFIFTLSQQVVDSTHAGIFVEQIEQAVRGPYTPAFIAPDADVLVASENPVSCSVIEDLLKATKVFVTTAENKQDFLDRLRADTFNIAFIDQQFFENDAAKTVELSAKIKELAPELPVYIFTEDETESETFYTEKGFNGTLALPVDSMLLERTIMRHLPHEMMEIPDKHVLIENLTEIPEPLRWLYTIDGLSVEEGCKNSGSIGHFVFSVQLFYDTIDTYAASLDEAYKKGDFALFRAKNGIVRTSAHVVGATELYELATSMDEACAKDDKLFIGTHIDELLSACRAFKDKLKKLEATNKGEAHV